MKTLNIKASIIALLAVIVIAFAEHIAFGGYWY